MRRLVPGSARGDDSRGLPPAISPPTSSTICTAGVQQARPDHLLLPLRMTRRRVHLRRGPLRGRTACAPRRRVSRAAVPGRSPPDCSRAPTPSRSGRGNRCPARRSSRLASCNLLADWWVRSVWVLTPPDASGVAKRNLARCGHQAPEMDSIAPQKMVGQRLDVPRNILNLVPTTTLPAAELPEPTRPTTLAPKRIEFLAKQISS